MNWGVCLVLFRFLSFFSVLILLLFEIMRRECRCQKVLLRASHFLCCAWLYPARTRQIEDAKGTNPKKYNNADTRSLKGLLLVRFEFLLISSLA